MRATWVGCLLVAAFAVSCSEETPVSEQIDVDQTSDALSQPQFECESTKRECLVAADCDADKRDACESAFRDCNAPVKAERDQVHETCRTEREACDAAATDEAGRHACHVAEHKCTLPVDPPEAMCHVDAEECVWAARGTDEPKMPPDKSEAEQACRAQERECRDAKRLHPEDLPKAPKCAPPPPPDCAPVVPPPAPATPAAPAPGPGDHSACERTKRECQVAADCDDAKRDACESAFRACEEPLRAERDRVHEMCRTSREACEEAATDEAARHACHMAEHKCNLPVEPPEAVCRLDAEECLWVARGMAEPPAPPKPMMPPSAAKPIMPPPVEMTPPKMMPPHDTDAEHACHEAERECNDAMRVPPEDLPKPPMCPPGPPKCMPKA